jgi:hypothetical protein
MGLAVSDQKQASGLTLGHLMVLSVVSLLVLLAHIKHRMYP